MLQRGLTADQSMPTRAAATASTTTAHRGDPWPTSATAFTNRSSCSTYADLKHLILVTCHYASHGSVHAVMCNRRAATALKRQLQGGPFLTTLALVNVLLLLLHLRQRGNSLEKSSSTILRLEPARSNVVPRHGGERRPDIANDVTVIICDFEEWANTVRTAAQYRVNLPGISAAHTVHACTH